MPYDIYANEIYRFVFWLSGDRFEAEEITPETFIRLWVRYNTIGTVTLKAYLLTIDSLSDALLTVAIGLLLWPLTLHIINGLAWDMQK